MNRYLLYSKTFNYDAKGNLWWSKGVTAKGNPSMTLIKTTRWNLKRLKRALIRKLKAENNGKRLTQEQLAAALREPSLLK